MTLERVIQQDFSGGVFRSVSPELIPANGAWDITNGLLAEDGAVFRRGGTSYRSASGVGGPPLVLWDGVLAAGGQQTVIARNGGVSTMDGAGAVTARGGTGVARPGRAVAFLGTLYLPGGQTWDGTTLGTAAEAGDFYAVVANRLLVVNGDRINFSAIGTTSFDPLDFHRIPGGVQILGIQGLRDAAAVFTTDGLWLISNMAYDLTDDAGNVQHKLDHYSSEIVLWGDAGIAPWSGGLIVPGNDGVWQVSLGVTSEAPVPFAPVSDPIQTLYGEYVRLGYSPGGAVVHQNHYLLPILSGTNVIDVLVCRLNARGRPWTRLAGWGTKATVFARRVNPANQRNELMAGHFEGRILDASYFTPSPSSETDADGSAFAWSITTRDYATGNFAPNTVVKLRASYQLEDTDGSNPTIEAFYVASRISTVGTKWGQFVWGTDTWSPGGTESVALEQIGVSAPEDSEGTHPFSWPVRKKARYVRFRLRSSSTASWLSLRALELFVRTAGKM